MANEIKSAQLGMPFGTASNRLRKLVLYNLLVKYKENNCYRCKQLIESVEELSIDHKIPWLGKDNSYFWDIENIAFSHLSCNSEDAVNPKTGNIKHPSTLSYKNGCRCDECRNHERLRRNDQRSRGIKT